MDSHWHTATAPIVAGCHTGHQLLREYAIDHPGQQ